MILLQNIGSASVMSCNHMHKSNLSVRCILLKARNWGRPLAEMEFFSSWSFNSKPNGGPAIYMANIVPCYLDKLF